MIGFPNASSQILRPPMVSRWSEDVKEGGIEDGVPRIRFKEGRSPGKAIRYQLRSVDPILKVSNFENMHQLCFEGTQFWNDLTLFDQIGTCVSHVFFHTEGLLFVWLCHGGFFNGVPRQGGSCWTRQVQVGSGYHDFDEYFLSAIEALRKTVPPIAGELSYINHDKSAHPFFWEALNLIPGFINP